MARYAHIVVTVLLVSGCQSKVEPHKTGEAATGGLDEGGLLARKHVDENADAAKMRRAFFGKLQSVVETYTGDCDALGAKLDPLKAEARAARDAKPRVSDADRPADQQAEHDALSPLVLGVGQCKDPAKVDSFMDVITGTVK